MQQSLSESFEQFSRREHRDMESRQRLTALLEEQIDQNEELRLENASLVENQRKLLQLLELRDQMLARAQSAKHPNDSRHESTFEQTRLLNDTVRHPPSPQKNPEQEVQLQAELESMRTSYEATRSANVSLEHRLNSLNALLLQKDQEVQKARLYNHEVYQKMEEQHEQDERELLRLKEKLYGATLELESRRKERLEAENSAEEQKQEQLRIQQEREQRLRAELEAARSGRQRAIRERDQAEATNQSLAASHREKLEQLTEALSQSKRQCEEMEEHLASSLQELKEKYQLATRQEEQLRISKQQLQRKSQQCQQLQMELAQLQDQAQNESMRDGQAVSELQEVVGKLKKEMDLQIRNNNTLRKEIIELERQAKTRQQTQMNEDSKLEEMQLTIEQLKSRNQREKEQMERTIERLQREVERKDKQLLEAKKRVKEMESELQNELENRNLTLEEMKEDHNRKLEINLAREKKLKEELQKSLEQTDKARSENRVIKRDLDTMEGRVRAIVTTMEEKVTSLSSQLQQSRAQTKDFATENDHLKRLYEKSELQFSDNREQLEAKQREVHALRRRTNDLEEQLNIANEQLTKFQTDQSKEEQVAKLKKEVNEWKVRLTSLTEANSKMKGHNTELVKETISLNEKTKGLEGELEKMRSEAKQSRQDRSSLESKIALLEQTLRQKSEQMEKSSPYITLLVEEKKMLELNNTKLANDVKGFQHLIDVAKKTKADEIVNLNRQVASSKKRLEQVTQELSQLKKRYDQDMREANKTIENNNREKVNMLRQNTVREDHYVKLEKDNKQLKEDKNALEDQVKRMQALFDQYQEHLQIAERIANENSDHGDKYEPQVRRSRLTVDPPAPSKMLDVSPIRSASHTKAHVSSTDGPRNVGHSLPGPASLQRHEVQQRIRGYQKDILGAD